jgi:hypothetical protein
MLFLLEASFSIGALHRHRLNTPADIFQTNNDGVIRRNRDIFSASRVKRIIAVKGQVPIVMDTVELVVLEGSVNAQFKKAQPTGLQAHMIAVLPGRWYCQAFCVNPARGTFWKNGIAFQSPCPGFIMSDRRLRVALHLRVYVRRFTAAREIMHKNPLKIPN